MTYNFLISSLLREFPNGEHDEWIVTDSDSAQVMCPIYDSNHVCVAYRFMQVLEEPDSTAVFLDDFTYFIESYTVDELWEEVGKFYYPDRKEFDEQPLYVKFECLFEERFCPEVIDTAENIYKIYLKKLDE